MKYKIYDTESIDFRYVHAASEFIYNAFEEFYSLFNKKEIIKVIADSLKTTSDINKLIYIINEKEKIIGLVCYHDYNEKNSRYMLSFKNIMQHIPLSSLDIKKIRDFSNNFTKIKYSGIYISRVFIDSSYRGKGIANRLFDYLFESKKFNFFLEVNSTNIRAIKFYEKMGFTVLENNTFLLMQKEY